MRLFIFYYLFFSRYLWSVRCLLGVGEMVLIGDGFVDFREVISGKVT